MPVTEPLLERQQSESARDEYQAGRARQESPEDQGRGFQRRDEVRKNIFGGVAVAASLALFSTVGVAASEATVDGPAQGDRTEIQAGSGDTLAEIEQALVDVEAAALNAEAQDEAAAEAPEAQAPEQAENESKPAVTAAPKSSEAEPETETETESRDVTAAPTASKPAPTPEPTESPEQLDGGSDSGSTD
jgi:hypothetical protein